MTSFLITALFIAALACAGVSDLRSRRIPNVLTAGALLLALALRSFLGLDALLGGVAGAALAVGVMLPLFALGGVGGGDAKLLIMVGAFLGPKGFFVAVLATALVGGLMSVAAAARAGVVLPALLNTGGLARWILSAGRSGERTTLLSPGAVSVPYGVAIAIGSAVALYLGHGVS
jgi:prepilin peptidase CpaA